MTLDAAIDEVLNERPGRSYREIAARIARRNLYLKADGLPAEPKQINARVRAADYGSKYRVDDNSLVWPA
ncbi:MAG TPA: hypothetical protein VNV44_07955 [Solirubrobacteraceae bacterium]|jgi:hypothetical protein|nr:hypothetical protein [Solirubrobacteraceae bacterium]